MHLNAYYARYEKYHVCYGGDEETRKANYGDMVCYIHRQGESLRESIKRHEHFLALQVGLKPGMKVYLHSPFIFVYCYDQGLSYRPIPAYRVYLGMGDEASPCSHVGRRGFASFPHEETRSRLVPAQGDEESPHFPVERRGVTSFSRKKTRSRLIPARSTSITGLNNNEYQISRGTVTDIFPTNIILQELNRIAGVSESCNFVKVKTLEFVGIAPAGSNRVSSFLEKAAEGLVEGGRKEIFTPMYFFLVRKPPSDS
ncbi:hypothetical protein B296_00019598 [Ensete ventricosum]|uniref:Sterol methyltransferase C-terminal domain-containing protein n=1 Tax=Ensete ventricosum TaxID=4639 RepID=A0A427ACK5_ENSVE|nr:hypothetical protein B296_00019598 [Ensete ventricosum]